MARFNTVPQARFYLEQSGQDFDPVVEADRLYKEALASVQKSIPMDYKKQVLSRDLVSRFQFAKSDAVIVVGQDGLVSNTAKYLPSQPIIGVNPLPDLYDGILPPFRASEIKTIIQSLLNSRATIREVTLAEALTSDGQRLLAFNDFFIGASSQISARYVLEQGNTSEVQSSSGIIVSTGAGSTGWLKSVYQGAHNVARAFGGGFLEQPASYALPWDTDELVFVVREPFPSKSTSAELGYGKFTVQNPLSIQSRMATEGVIFSDGLEEDYIAFNAGMKVTIQPAAQKARLVVRK